MDEGLLIDIIEQYPCIYNKSLKDFKNARCKENAWTQIALGVEETVEECQRVWRNVRERFTKVKRDLRTCPSGSEQREPTWHLYRRLGFLEPHILPRKTLTNLKAEDCEQLSVFIEDDLMDPAADVITPNDTSRTTPSASKRPRRDSDVRKRDDKVALAIDELSSFITSKKKTAEQAFGEFVGLALLNMTEKQKRHAKKEIMGILDDSLNIE